MRGVLRNSSIGSSYCGAKRSWAFYGYLYPPSYLNFFRISDSVFARLNELLTVGVTPGSVGQVVAVVIETMKNRNLKRMEGK